MSAISKRLSIRVGAFAFLLGVILQGLLVPFSTTAQSQNSAVGTPQAENSVKFSIRPNQGDNPDFFDNVEVNPGQTVTLEAVVDNWGDVPVDLILYVVNGNSSPNGGFVASPRGEKLRAYSEWIQLSTDSVTVQPNTSEMVTLTIPVPEGAEPGQYVSGVVAATAEAMAMPGSDTIDHVIRYAMAVSVIVPGEFVYEFVLGEPEVAEGALIIPISNTGNYRLRPQGNIDLKNSGDEVILTAPIQMGSVYSGLSTEIHIFLPVQLPEGEYVLSVSLEDPESGASASLEEVTVVFEEEIPTDYEVVSASVVPNAETLAFANIDIVVSNSGEEVAATNVVLRVFLNGDLVEEFPLATNQVFLRGDNAYSTRYIPEDMWSSGTYEFEVVVKAVSPNGGPEVYLLEDELDAQILVP